MLQDLPPVARNLMGQLAIWAVPLSITLMIVVSRLTAPTCRKT